MVEGSAGTVIKRPPCEVFDVVADLSRVGDWSPECTGGGLGGPRHRTSGRPGFEGDNVVETPWS